MKIFNMLFFVLCTIYSISAQTNYARVKINLQETPLEAIATLGLEVDHGVLQKNRYLINDYSDDELTLLEEHGIPYKIIVSDVKQHYVNQNAVQTRSEKYTCNVKAYNYRTPDNYTYGSMGGYHTYDELLSTLDSMHAAFPNLISKKKMIGSKTTYEGRPIFWLKIGDKPNVDEDEPEILYTALHHAREPQSLAQMLFYMWYLLENYENDALIKGLVDHTEMYFIPCINPDGYVHNEMTDSNGGGLWRKNRKPADGGAKGVDINRNYDYKWGHDESGSSSNPNSNTFRGTSGFSEAETQAVRDFSLEHDFKIVMNYHAFGNYLIYPWGFDGNASSDDLTFKGYGDGLTAENNFDAGTSVETVGYGVNGSSDDWMYGELGIFAFTPEVGHIDFGFWPPRTEIDRLNKSVFKQNLVAAQLLHDYVKVNVLPDTNQSLDLDIVKLSKDENLLKVKVKSLDKALVFVADSVELGLNHLERDTVLFPYEVIQDYIVKEEVPVLVESHYKYYTIVDTVLIRIINEDFEVIYSENGEDLQDWGTKKWGVSSSKFVSNPGSLTDSPKADYLPFSESMITLTDEIDLVDAEKALLTFYATWEIEEDFDYAQVLISTNGENFNPICGKYTTRGNEFQDLNQPVYEGYQPTWVKEEIDLADYLGEKIWIQFRLISDAVEEQDGIYIDNIKVEIVEKQQSSSTHSLGLDNRFSIFPNPAKQRINIQGASEVDVDVRIYDQLGRLMLERSKPANGGLDFTIDIRSLVTGVYYIEFAEEGEKVQTVKMVKLP
ncbi:M14 family zinc carboxypeptidase [Portibacter lacus]|uniref:carboxypeptidase T n=1 Tax=Portibacter lacus TaxID=1099794 RepID=A0AA37SNV0_9BACT|nr:M14 family zinc carboxypeptidase [Portibacter lacus]GLR16191.1 hypothetical protein GCM10007940_08060 [Portibacter lacus]